MKFNVIGVGFISFEPTLDLGEPSGVVFLSSFECHYVFQVCWRAQFFHFIGGHTIGWY
jgi:hypothetical protein